MAHTVSFQYMEPGDDQPRAGYELTDAEFPLPDGMHTPRIGEFIQLVTADKTASYEVLAVHTRIVMLGEPAEVGWHSYVTLGPVDHVDDKRLLAIRE